MKLLLLFIMFVDDPIAQVYSQKGAGALPYFVGKQYGAGWLRSLARIAFPIIKKAVGFAGNVAANTAEDIIENKRAIGDSIKANVMDEVGRIFKSKRPTSSSINRSKAKRRKVIKNIRQFFTNEW